MSHTLILATLLFTVLTQYWRAEGGGRGVFQVDLEGGIPILGTWNLGAQNKSIEKKKKKKETCERLCHLCFVESIRNVGYHFCLTQN